MKTLFGPSRLKRSLFFLTGDIVLLSLTLVAGYYLRFDLHLPHYHQLPLLLWMPVVVLMKILLLRIFGLYNISWSFVGLVELVNILKALTIALFIFFIGNLYIKLAAPTLAVPRSIILLDFVLGVAAISSFRVSKRLYISILKNQRLGRRTVIIGAGPTGERLVREFLRMDPAVYSPVFFVDDAPIKAGNRIHGIPVRGTIEDLPDLLKGAAVETAIIAITTLNHAEVKRIFDILVENSVDEIKVVPHISRLPEHAVSVKDIQDIDIEDLLYREPVSIDEGAVREFIAGKTVLVSGAGGSIGSEAVLQLLRFRPVKVVCLDIDETEIFHLQQRLDRLPSTRTVIVPFVGDVRDDRTLEALFSAHKPSVVFHAAAYKHVPMMELFPQEAAGTNIIGTWRLGRAALRHGVERFVNISTDKAVNPTSIMGATKRMAETVCTALNGAGGTRFISVRFGNVLASRGSVIPIFLEQIKNGGPVTVTDPKVQRYFMSIPEAVMLVFQAAAMGGGGEVFVLDMGKPVAILQLAEDLIRLNHFEPYKDIKIAFTGLRPGEKLFEELLTAEEGTTSTSHKKIFVARASSIVAPSDLDRAVTQFEADIVAGPEAVRKRLKEIVPFYSPHY
ncbi:MAG TPA: polysaccharide biosynthesis protein [Syntrophus sp. (in: bacteria)]|nr:polysaccharide biosynthesis protein [Syntrophus sp. (in: bacteria)]